MGCKSSRLTKPLCPPGTLPAGPDGKHLPPDTVQFVTENCSQKLPPHLLVALSNGLIIFDGSNSRTLTPQEWNSLYIHLSNLLNQFNYFPSAARPRSLSELSETKSESNRSRSNSELRSFSPANKNTSLKLTRTKSELVIERSRSRAGSLVRTPLATPLVSKPSGLFLIDDELSSPPCSPIKFPIKKELKDQNYFDLLDDVMLTQIFAQKSISFRDLVALMMTCSRFYNLISSILISAKKANFTTSMPGEYYFLISKLNSPRDVSLPPWIEDLQVAELVANFPLIVRISLKATRITDDCVSSLLKLKNLVSLELSMTCISDLFLESLSNDEIFLSKLQVLILAGCREISNNGLSFFKNKCNNLVLLSLALCSNITDTGVVNCLKGAIFLEKLDLRETKITDSTLHYVADNLINLKVLDIRGCGRTTDTSWQRVAQSLPDIDLRYSPPRLIFRTLELLRRKIRQKRARKLGLQLESESSLQLNSFRKVVQQMKKVKESQDK
ncbi:hypothetical protein RCL1_009018 [Eukaryota sp. TZLM3-RCL]